MGKISKGFKKNIHLDNTSVNVFLETSICLLVNKLKFENVFVFHYILLWFYF